MATHAITGTRLPHPPSELHNTPATAGGREGVQEKGRRRPLFTWEPLPPTARKELLLGATERARAEAGESKETKEVTKNEPAGGEPPTQLADLSGQASQLQPSAEAPSLRVAPDPDTAGQEEIHEQSGIGDGEDPAILASRDEGSVELPPARSSTSGYMDPQLQMESEGLYTRESASLLPPGALVRQELSEDNTKLQSPAQSSSKMLDIMREGGSNSPDLSQTVSQTVPRPKGPAADPKAQQLDEIKALTMHQMVDSDSTGRRKLIFLTNHQAKLFQMNNIASFLESFDYPTPKLVIWFMPCSGGSSTINSGMLSSFKALRPSDPGFEQKWKELLKIQADNSPDPGYCQDVLPIAPFDTDEDLFKAEWKMECFMRDVLVPLAAETNALIVGSAFQDASLMMMFARVAKSLGSKYGGMGASPWTMLGFAGAPKLLKSLGDPKSTACEWFKLSKRWQDRKEAIVAAKQLSDLGDAAEDENGDGKVDERDKRQFGASLEMGRSDVDIPYDINSDLDNIIIIDCVQEREGFACGIEMSAKAHIEAVIMDYLVAQLAVIGIGTLHAVGGYGGLAKAANYLNMKVPLLFLDVRQDPAHPDGLGHCSPTGKAVSVQGGNNDLMLSLEEAMRLDHELTNGLASQGKADIYEVCRIARFHSQFLAKKIDTEDKVEPATIWEAMEMTRKAMKSANNSEEIMRRQYMLDTIMEHCVQKEFENYWNLFSEKEKQVLKDVEGIESYKQKFQFSMVDARAAYSQVLSSDLLYTGHASDLTELSFLVNNVLMKKDRLPEANSLDGLLMLRASWDIVDIAIHQLRFFKTMAKLCYLALLMLGLGIVIITVQSAEVDATMRVDIAETGSSLKGAQFLTFCFSLVSAFVAAVQAFYNPVRRWQQVRDAAETMQSCIWQYRTRTAQFKQGSEGPAASTQALSEAVVRCKEAIMVSADIQETSFHRFYPEVGAEMRRLIEKTCNRRGQRLSSKRASEEKRAS